MLDIICTAFFEKDFWWNKIKIKKLLKVAYFFSRSFSSDTHREKASEWRKV